MSTKPGQLQNITGSYNTASGFSALYSNTTGYNNTASGVLALRDNTSGIANTASGSYALLNTTTGGANTACGAYALSSNTTGYSNTALGFGAGSNANTGSNNVFIANGGYSGDTSLIKIGTAGIHSKTYMAGVRGVTTGVADAITVMIDSAGQLGTVSSSRRTKEDVRNMAEASDRLLALRPVSFRYKEGFAGGGKPIQFGLIAEEVAEVFPELVVYDAEGERETVKYHLLSSLLLNELQKQQAELATLRQEVAELRSVTARLTRVEALLEEAPRLAAERRPPGRQSR